ncbi:hypothetical protein [Sediminicoccus rosea]|uniref:Uncharacterized protein n=1 Tax=Sediminicoccus rosea TaxID=1225128 RepID=A0ABZ0PCS3_9PROT|nr:hypothetical protein [Sediminicoccus rosea]WPB83091.1 hypothetical protein R9Z33_13350 [Sediminicoccus rosea]
MRVSIVAAEPAADKADAVEHRPRTVGLPVQRSVTGISENTLRRIHADEIAAGRPGFLIKAGRATLLSVDAWGRWVERQPPAHMLSDRKATAA